MPITLSKSFSPTTIVDGGITTLTFTVIVNEMFPQPVIQIFDTLPSGLAFAGNANVPPGWIVFQIPPVGSNGVIQADGISLPNGTYTLSFDITNLPGQTNPSCEFNPPSFTNQSSNLVLLPPIFVFDGVPSCLIVTEIPPRKKKNNRVGGFIRCPDEIIFKADTYPQQGKYCNQIYNFYSLDEQGFLHYIKSTSNISQRNTRNWWVLNI